MKFSPLKANIKNIIFDLGGVILNIDPVLTLKRFETLGVKDTMALHKQLNTLGIFDNYETNTINSPEFRDAIRRVTDISLTDWQIDEAWNAMLLDIPEHRISLLNKLKAHYRTFLLSNTNDIHLNYYTRMLQAQHDINLNALFEKAYYSHLIGKRKPDKAAWNIVLQENNIAPGETLFIDDRLENIEAARELGLIVFHLDVRQDVVHFFHV